MNKRAPGTWSPEKVRRQIEAVRKTGAAVRDRLAEMEQHVERLQKSNASTTDQRKGELLELKASLSAVGSAIALEASLDHAAARKIRRRL